jgi:hypothetical protein
VALDAFLREVHRMQAPLAERDRHAYPALPKLLTSIDTAIHRKMDMTPDWRWDRLPAVRTGIEYAILLSLQARLGRVENNHYFGLFMGLRPDPDGPTAISLNYDTLVDHALFELGAWNGWGSGVPDYGCTLSVPTPRQPFGRIFKLHGSANWLRCHSCDRIEVLRASEWGIHHANVPKEFLARSVSAEYRKPHLACSGCGGEATAFIVAPSHRKDYKSRALDDIWARAAEALKGAEHVYFIGYSLPDDDVEISLLLRNSLARHDEKQITVVVHDEAGRSLQEHDEGKRYAAMFGNVDWYPKGFISWLREQQTSSDPFRKGVRTKV